MRDYLIGPRRRNGVAYLQMVAITCSTSSS
ncbi:hypothetical protein ABIB49_003527 [Arthrobacter sp. UYCu512]